MNICYICDKELMNVNTNTMEKKLDDGRYICIPCYQVKSFFSFDPPKKINKPVI